MRPRRTALVIPVIELNPFQARSYVIEEQIKAGKITLDAQGHYLVPDNLRDLRTFMNKPVRVPVIPPERADKARQAFVEGDVCHVLSCARGSHYLPELFLANLTGFKAIGRFETALALVITRPSLGPSISPALMRDLLRAADRTKLRACGDPLPGPGPFTLYRGLSRTRSTRAKRGCSWTSTLACATWFARRLSDEAVVYRIRVAERAVMLYTDQRNEDEYVVIVPPRVKVVEVEPATEEDAMAWRENAESTRSVRPSRRPPLSATP